MTTESVCSNIICGRNAFCMDVEQSPICMCKQNFKGSPDVACEGKNFDAIKKIITLNNKKIQTAVSF